MDALSAMDSVVLRHPLEMNLPNSANVLTAPAYVDVSS